MVEAYVQLPDDGTGKKMRTEELTVGANSVHEEHTRATVTGLIERLAYNILKRLNVDSTGRLRVGDATITSGTITTVGTVTTAATIGSTAIASMTATAFTQAQAFAAFQQGFRSKIAIV